MAKRPREFSKNPRIRLINLNTWEVLKLGKAIVPSQTNLIVKKSNALMRCHWEINGVYESRIIAVLAARIHTDDTDFKNYEIPVAEFLGKDYNGHDLEELRKSVTRLMRCLLEIDMPNGGWKAYTLLSMGEYIPKKGVIKLRFDPDMKPHYLSLKERFAQYSLAEFMELPSVYSQRLFEVLKSWSDRPEVEITLDDLHKYLNTPASCRKNFGEFKRQILDKAQKHIVLREGSTLKYEWEAIKAPGRGGKITALRFWFEKTKAASRPSGAMGTAAVKLSPGQSAKELEQKCRIECRDCFQSHTGHCGNYDKEPSEIRGRGPKKKLCVFCLTDGPVATDKMFARMTESGELAFLGIRPRPKAKPEEKQSTAI